ncbi:hypothetical protein BC936DRAFT_144141 [Jimgerdemannia flammicorona]|uniref:EF-hand domain-containing protein n=1 Tax=Jimgerdemannia flammicorona TaxID=994334 RepID=A0A433DCX6_9FUNG|nr:hypothetical protein BC936DRAFT_144141 [Jimgerdemannia flammicorona]
MDVDFTSKLVEVRPRQADGIPCKPFYVPYDILVVGIGAQSITHGVTGIENVHFLKNVKDAVQLKKQIIDNYERASIPGTTPEERRKLLSFVVCGGGPTGVEFAAELLDMINEDLVYFFPKILREEVSVNIIQSRDHILNTFDAGISKYAERKFKRENLNIITNARVNRVDPGMVVYSEKPPGEEPVIKEIPFGLCLWSTGIAMTPFAQLIASHLPEAQKNNRALEVDSRLRLKGIPDGSVYSLGDCSTIENPRLVDHIMDIFIKADKDKSGALSWDEFRDAVKSMVRKFPITETHVNKLQSLFERYDEDHSGTIDMDELRKMLSDIDKKFTSLPATAQVAHQQGKFLGIQLSKLASMPPDQAARCAAATDDDDGALEPFRYKHLGSFAYIGNTAVGEIGPGIRIMGGLWSLYLWRSIYLSEQGGQTMAISWTSGDTLIAQWRHPNRAKQQKLLDSPE